MNVETSSISHVPPFLTDVSTSGSIHDVSINIIPIPLRTSSPQTFSPHTMTPWPPWRTTSSSGWRAPRACGARRACSPPATTSSPWSDCLCHHRVEWKGLSGDDPIHSGCVSTRVRGRKGKEARRRDKGWERQKRDSKRGHTAFGGGKTYSMSQRAFLGGWFPFGFQREMRQ